MADILFIPDLITKHDIDAVAMLRNIADEKPKHAFVITWPEDGSMPNYHSSTGDTAVVLLRLHEFVHKYYSGDFII